MPFDVHFEVSIVKVHDVSNSFLHYFYIITTQIQSIGYEFVNFKEPLYAVAPLECILVIQSGQTVKLSFRETIYYSFNSRN